MLWSIPMFKALRDKGVISTKVESGFARFAPREDNSRSPGIKDRVHAHRLTRHHGL